MVTTNCMSGLKPLKTLIAKPRLNEMVPRVAQNSRSSTWQHMQIQLILKKYNVIPENSRHDMPLQAI
jgi:hypothetical protein